MTTPDPAVEWLALDKIRLDGGSQVRAAICEEAVAKYAEAIAAGATFPPLDVFYDGAEWWLANGFHRYHAARRVGADTFPALVRPGTKRDAVLFAAGSNREHGLRRSNEDKRKAVLMLLRDAEWSKWSSREIARRCGVLHSFVDEARFSLATVASENPALPVERTYTTKHGKEASMRVSEIGSARRQRTEPPP